ncbi:MULTISPECIES: hypothetical protein [unclassified Phaeobacter]|uniref:hypothetical protein n=1 Tax=unclassified Phaeobacter TaxID=2621772 RepID=UPI003A85B1FA
MNIFEHIKADREAGTPDLGGWAWFGGRDDLYLATNRGGRRYVMGFKRKGTRSAQPTFQVGGIMHGAIDDLTEYEVGNGVARGQAQADECPTVYRMDVKSVDHPDARRLTRIPQLERIALAAEALLNSIEVGFDEHGGWIPNEVIDALRGACK